jgi:hypothetical protein
MLRCDMLRCDMLCSVQLRDIKPKLKSRLRLKEFDGLQAQTTVVEIVSMDLTRVEMLCTMLLLLLNVLECALHTFNCVDQTFERPSFVGTASTSRRPLAIESTT